MSFVSRAQYSSHRQWFMVLFLKNVLWGVVREYSVTLAHGFTPNLALSNLVEIDFPSFWLLLGAPRSVWEPLEAILAAGECFWLPLGLSVRPCCVPREQICVPWEQFCMPGAWGTILCAQGIQKTIEILLQKQGARVLRLLHEQSWNRVNGSA